MRESATGASRPAGCVYKNGAHSKSKLLYLFIPGGVVSSISPGFLLPIKYVGFPAKADPPILSVAIWAMLPLGLLLTAAGHRMSRGQWKGVSRQVHAQLAMSGLAFAATTFRDTLAGAHVRPYPAGILLCISVLLMASRLVMKFVARERCPWEQNW